MSGDVQPRKRKDKKKKRDDESSHGVHITKMGTDDVHLHVHQEHGTGGHWCAKVIFFSLMAVLMGLVCLIILENRGIQDVDTPLSESRFSNYFNGWVDEHRLEHDDHQDGSHDSLEHDDHDDNEHEDHEHDDEPFEEEADHSEGEEEVADEEDENVTPEEENEDENVTRENLTAEEVDDDEEEEEDNATVEEDNATAEEEAEENVTLEDENVTAEQNDEADDDEDAYKTNEEDDNMTKETTKSTSKGVHDDEDDAFDEEDDDGNFDSFEKIVDNDATEIELLKEKARQQAAAESKQNAGSVENDINEEADNAPSWASSLAVKIGVGLALALVARLVLLRKNPISSEEPTPEILMKRRLTIASPDEEFPEEAGDVDEPFPEDEYSEEEIEIEEEIEYIEEDEEPAGEENQVDAGGNVYVPETFEQLNAMYRPKNYKEEIEMKTETKPSKEHKKTETYSFQSPYTTSFNNSSTTTNNNSNNNKLAKDVQGPTEPLHKSISYNEPNQLTEKQPDVFGTPSPPPLDESKITVFNKCSPPKEESAAIITLKKDTTCDMDYEKLENVCQDTSKGDNKKQITYAMDYQPENDDIDYDEDDIYDDEEGQDDDSEEVDDEDLLDDDEDLDEGEVSDVDDTDLMNRLEAKYGKLPAKEYESDEDPDDPTWTRIKPKTGNGPQSLEDDDPDLFEQELRKANDEMMREFNYH